MTAYLVTYGSGTDDRFAAYRFESRTSALIAAGSSPLEHRHVLVEGERDDGEPTTVELVAIYTALDPGNAPTRFESRAAGLRRLLAKLGERAVPYVNNPATSPNQEASMPENDTNTTTGRRPRYDENQVVEVLTDANPKRAGTKASERFDALMGLGRRTTVKAALEVGVTAADLAYDHKHGYVKVHAAHHHA